MSRLAFDDIFKAGPSLGSIAARADAKSRTSSAKGEESTSFDDKFKQAVGELHPNEKPTSSEESDQTEINKKPLKNSSEKNQTEKSATDSKKDNSESGLAKPDSEEVSTDVELSPELAAKPHDPEDPDDALIAMVMAAAALEQEEVSTAEALTTDTVIETANLTDSPTENLTENPTGKTLTPTPIETIDSADQDALQQDTTQSEPVAPLIASSEVVVPQKMETSSEAAQATVSTTTEVDPAQANPTKVSATQETTATAGASPESSDQQDSMDMDQDPNPEEGKNGTAGKSQISAANGSSGQGEEPLVEVTDNKQDTTDATVKVNSLLERPAATTASETRPGQGTSNAATQQNTQPPLDTTDRVRFVERVAQAFNAQSAANGSIRMRLHPEELGSIKIEMIVRDGTMHARIETETREARNVLLDNLPALRERLATHEIKIEQFEIDYNAGGDQHGAPNGPDDWPDSDRNGSNRSTSNHSDTTEETDNLEPSAPRAVSRAGSGKQIDVTA